MTYKKEMMLSTARAWPLSIFFSSVIYLAILDKKLFQISAIGSDGEAGDEQIVARIDVFFFTTIFIL